MGRMPEAQCFCGPTVPGISFCISSGRVVVFLKSLETLGFPEYIKFYVNPTKRAVAIQTCGIDDDGAKRVPYGQNKEGASIKIMYLTKLVYEICNWDRKKTYRVSGDYYPANQVICFDLNKPCEIVDGKVAAAETV